MPRFRNRAVARSTLAAVGVTALAGVVLTAAALTDTAETRWVLDGSKNRFDIVTAGALEPDWKPQDSDWHQGNPDPYEVAIGENGEGVALGPGHSLEATVAVANASPRDIAGRIGLKILDPNPLGDATDPDTGRYLELFDQLRFTVVDGTTVLADRVSADEFNDLAWQWPDPVAAGENRTLAVTISLPAEVDNRWQGAGTQLQFAFAGENT
ncbi:hypothetical protein GCM10009847_17970 [Leucobacter tardus]|uniref:Uncharacterized protein n=1 Tax=Leucobacter tardus TaxID=501483 RepID=A0A939TNM3_9MICO|nr:hypothetical protein [Leucobacter tardus]MBO2990688.1 hypothetical protein [Leucobacter tardus]